MILVLKRMPQLNKAKIDTDFDMVDGDFENSISQNAAR